MANGVPQSYFIDEFADEGIMLEGAAGPPDYAAMTFPFAGEKHRELMLQFRNISQFGLMVSDLSRGCVRERAGRVEIRYDLNARGHRHVQARHRAAVRALRRRRRARDLPAGRRAWPS